MRATPVGLLAEKSSASDAFGPFEAWAFFRQTVRSMERHFDEVVRPAGLTGRQLEVLLALGGEEAASGGAASTVAERLGLSSAETAGLFERLRRAGQVRALGVKDRRFAPTTEGSKLRASLKPSCETMLREALLVLATQAAVGYFWSIPRGKAARPRRTRR